MIYQVLPKFGRDYHIWADGWMYQSGHPRRLYPIPIKVYESIFEMMNEDPTFEPRIKLHWYKGKDTVEKHLHNFHAYEVNASVIINDIPKSFGKRYVWLDFTWMSGRFSLWEVKYENIKFQELRGYEVRLR